jgi:Putative vitamin uptake transporter
MSYLFGDILTEVYGYARSRRVVWSGFSALFASFISWVVLSLPPAPSWHQQAAYETVFGTTQGSRSLRWSPTLRANSDRQSRVRGRPLAGRSRGTDVPVRIFSLFPFSIPAECVILE